MGKLEARKSIFSDRERVADHHYKARNERFVIMESCDDHDHEDNICDSGSMESSQENSTNSIASSSSSDLVEDASSTSVKSCSSSSSASPPSSSSSNGPLYELSELMVHLPLRRGLSKFYQGKSQSFTSLASVKSLEDLPKKIAPFKKKLMKSCKSYGGGLDGTNKLHYPKAIISKKSSRGSNFFPSLGSFRPSVAVQKSSLDRDQRSNPVQPVVL